MTISAAEPKTGSIVVRPSRDADVQAMLAIYLHHIKKGVDPAYVGDIETPDAEDIKRRRKSMRGRKMPHIVAEENGVVIGYAYAVPFRKRPAYRYTVKHSIYVHHDQLGRGVGQMLMTALIDYCAAGGFRQMIGYIDAREQTLARPPREVRLPPSRLTSAGRLQVRALDGFGNDAALAGPRRLGAAGHLGVCIPRGSL